MDIAGNLAHLRKEIPPHIKIIAVSKTMPVSAMMDAYRAGQRSFGENKVQEVVHKQPVMPPDTEWHLIGHLQSNKVRQIVPFVSLIHSVDSLKLLSEINSEASKINRIVDCLLQMHIAVEETKFGLSFEEIEQIVNSKEYRNFRNVKVRGLMGMATFTNDEEQIKREFHQLSDYFQEIKRTWFPESNYFAELSMGMSGDYKLAIEAGSTMVRIGSLIFGERTINR